MLGVIMYKNMFGSIKDRVKLAVSAFVVLSIILIVTVFSLHTRYNIINSSTRFIKVESDNNAEMIDNWIEKQVSIATTLSNQIKYMDYEYPELIVDVLNANISSNPDAMEYYICYDHDYEHINPETNKSQLGAAWAHDGYDIPIDPTERPWYSNAVKAGYDGFALSDPYIDAVTGSVVVSLSKLVNIEGHQAVILFDITADTIVNKVNNIITDSKNESAFLVTADGLVITHPNNEYLMTPEGSTILTNKVNLNLNESDVIKFTDYDNNTKYLSLSTVQSTNWILGVAQNTVVVDRQIQKMIILPVIIGLVSIILCIIYLTVLLNKQLAPLNNMKTFINNTIVDKTANNKYSTEVEEIKFLMSELQHSFIDTIKETKNKTDSIEENMEISANNVRNIANGIVEVSTVIEGVTNKTEQQTASVQEINASCEELNNSMSILSTEATNMLERSTEISTKLSETIPEMLENKSTTVNTIASSHETLRKAIDDAKVIEEIKLVSDTIDDIADQTNLLALNASIEAARAGESGKGFAVVANEINNLSASTSQQIEKVKTLTEQVTKSVNALVNESDMLLSFIDTTIIPDYNKLEQISTQYKSDAEYYSKISKTFSDKTNKSVTDISNVTNAISKISTNQENIFAEMENASANIEELRASSEEIAEKSDKVLNDTKELKITTSKFTI